jgi:hypothetical protein
VTTSWRAPALTVVLLLASCTQSINALSRGDAGLGGTGGSPGAGGTMAGTGGAISGTGGAISGTGGGPGAGGGSPAGSGGSFPGSGGSHPGTGGAGGASSVSCLAPPPAAGAVWSGALEIGTAADVAAARGYAEVTGGIFVDAAFSGVVDLPDIVSVGGDVYIESTGVTAVRMPNLSRLTGMLWMYLNLSLSEADFRSVGVASRVFINRNPKLTLIRMDSLRQADGGLEITDAQIPVCLAQAIVAAVATPPAPSNVVGIPSSPCTCDATSCADVVEVCP